MNNKLTLLKSQLSQICELIEDKNDVMYFDYPLHTNVGDLLIYLGTEQFFKDYNINVRLRRCIPTFDINEIKQLITPKTTLLCHGGGNFGDLYPDQQKLREDLVIHFPQNRIIVLPQTAFFSKSENLKISSDIFQAHPQCYLFARDDMTKGIMSAFSNHVFLSPDMAHQLYGSLPIKAQDPNKNNTLYFLRKDIEASDIERNIQATLSTQDIVRDWEDVINFQDRVVLKLSNVLSAIGQKYQAKWIKDAVNTIWFNHSNRIVNRMIKLFSSYDKVVTSRLHGHIFSCLLELPNEVCNNSYGKNFGYYEKWTYDVDFAKKYQLENKESV